MKRSAGEREEGRKEQRGGKERKEKKRKKRKKKKRSESDGGSLRSLSHSDQPKTNARFLFFFSSVTYILDDSSLVSISSMAVAVAHPCPPAIFAF